MSSEWSVTICRLRSVGRFPVPATCTGKRNASGVCVTGCAAAGGATAGPFAGGTFSFGRAAARASGCVQGFDEQGHNSDRPTDEGGWPAAGRLTGWPACPADQSADWFG